MISLNVKTRNEFGSKTNSLKRDGLVPAVVYGHNLKKNDHITVDGKEFKKVLKEAGESSLLELQIDGDKKEIRTVLIHEVQKDPLSGNPIHIDFFQPNLKEEVEVEIPLVFEGVAPAEKELGGTFVKNMSEIEVKALPQNLPHEIKVDISILKTFDDQILIENITLPADVKVLKKPEEIVASVLPPQKIEEELAKEIEENVEDIEKIEKKEKEEDEVTVEEPKE